jgi:hypothetical protein
MPRDAAEFNSEPLGTVKRERRPPVRLYCRERPDLEVSISRNGGRRLCISRVVNGKRERKSADPSEADKEARVWLAEMYRAATFKDLDLNFGIIRSDPAPKSSGGAKKYRGQSPFTDFGEVINPREIAEREQWPYIAHFHWVERSPIPGEWKAVYSYMVNDARETGIYRSGPAAIAAALGMTLNGVKGIQRELETYRLVSASGEGWKSSIAYRFHRVEWMNTHQPRWWVNPAGGKATHQPGGCEPTNAVTSSHQPDWSHSRKEKNPNTESARACLREPSRNGAAKDSGLRSESSGDGSRFARTQDAVPDDPLWLKLCKTLGNVEMTQNGALWLKRFTLCRDALATAVSDYLAMPAERRAVYPAAAYLTTAFENEKRKFGDAH